MKERTVREALLSMHYRESRPGRWTKPVGYHLFTFNEKSRLWQNWFMDTQGQFRVWDSHTIGDDRALSDLKMHEAYTRTNVEPSAKAAFHGLGLDI